MMKRRENKSLRAVSAFGLAVIVGLALSFQACAPRSSTMCVNPAANEWVQCPAGVAPGTTLEDASQVQPVKKATTKKQTTKKRTTTKKK